MRHDTDGRQGESVAGHPAGAIVEAGRVSPEPTIEDLQGRVTEAQEALLAKARETPDEWLDPEELRKDARNGSGGDVMMFALTDLVNQRKLDLRGDLRVRLGTARDQ